MPKAFLTLGPPKPDPKEVAPVELKKKSTSSWYHKHRPTSLGQVIGQDEAIRALEKRVEEGNIPHVALFTGPSGCGKTTVAKILRTELKCGDADYQEINCGTLDNPLDAIRSIKKRVGLSPISGPCRVWVLDELHTFSRSRNAMEALLDILENYPPHVYFFVCTTDPQKLLKTIHTRCTEIKLGLISQSDLKLIVRSVCKKEKVELSDIVLDTLVEVAEGSGRKAIVHLEQIAPLKNEDERLDALQKSDSKRQAIEIARALIDTRKPWSAIAAILKELDEEPETLRRLILGYAQSVLLGGGKSAARAWELIEIFRTPLYDVGKPGLVADCYNVCHKK